MISASINANARLDAKSYSLGMRYTMGAGHLMGAVGHTKNALFPDSDVTLIALGYDHHLSKRTDVYLVFAQANNQANAQYALGGASYSGGFTTAGGQDARAVQFGMRHRF